MDDIVKEIFTIIIKIDCKDFKNLDGQLIPREILLDTSRYDEIQEKINKLKKFLSSSSLTSLQNTAGLMQKWPIINLTRQLLKIYHYTMEPIRKSDGYDQDGKKKYRRFFIIKKEIN